MRAPLVRRRTSVLLLARAAPACGGHLSFYFTGEGAATGDQVYLATARGHAPSPAPAHTASR